MVHNFLRNPLLLLTGKRLGFSFNKNLSTTMDPSKYKTLDISIPEKYVYMVKLNRPDKLNALNSIMWEEFTTCFNELDIEPNCRAIVLSGAGKLFCAGLDFEDMLQLGQKLADHEDVGRRCKVLEQLITKYQNSFSAIEKCCKPVLAAVHGACVGGGVDMISAADIRYSTSDAWFQIKEVDIGMAADVGTLQRFPKIVGSDSLVRELVYTARKFPAVEAMNCGFISRIFDTQETLLRESIQLAKTIASKSPVAVQGSKLNLIYSRDHSVQEGLAHIAMRNQAMLQSEDFINATMSQATKGEPPLFAKL